MEKSQIEVVYLDGTTSRVSHDVLDVLIATGKIQSFKRCNGWVNVIRGNARLRDYRNEESYSGPERRTTWEAEKE